jgi:prepilin-type N-terminal cleavage/methylation domain-containing protein
MTPTKGITLVELIIVLAIIAIVGAILIPNFLNATDKARLRSDIQSARVIQGAMELFGAEQGRSLSNMDIDDVIDELNDMGYIKASDAVIQTEDAVWVIDANRGVLVDLSGVTNHDIRNRAYNQLSEQEKRFVRGGVN